MAASFRWQSTLQDCRVKAAAEVRRLCAELEADPGALSRRQAGARRRATEEREAGVMKMADGGFHPAYNLQFAANTKSGAVAGFAADNLGTDTGKLAPRSAALEGRYGRRPGEHQADGG